ncbi:hypothetical protein ISF_05509 [Cordyceps fumosorosea ARSEF 2679]|uniref:Uncharacterized protein n=1 Tax=Cordyceps fumosorosea (strain ARSEF 2679) TaxID=1081104 RepID=A0A167UBW2_CORFA|nr:hypothetical protein ISF_05509 [Cordyceps fumosorosea ARSEF 2679]OAA61430.1 hypothetical protein ISF_05509 [Cordyceps fumosorosea ARSEF 2679]
MALQSVLAPGLPETESHVLQQYQKIIRFRDEILAGKHATIKVPDSLREAALSLSTDDVHECTPENRPREDNTAFASKHAVGSFLATPNVAPPPEPHPVHLSKPDELLCAELQRQRKRIEQELWEDVQRNSSQQNGSGTLPEFDASAVLAKALLLVPEVNFCAQTQEGASSGNGPDQDSFDDNTFYSSQHDTPEFQPASPVPVSSAVPAASTAPAQPPPANSITANAVQDTTRDERRTSSVTKARQLRTYDELTETPAVRKQPSSLPGLNNYADNSATGLSQPNAAASSATASVGKQTIPIQPSSYIDLHPPSPLLQNRTRALPGYLATGYPAQPPQPSEIPGFYGGAENSINSARAPAQVAALRSEPGSRTSPESSSQGGQGKRKNKKKKRKSDRLALESQQSFASSTHQIKAEPRSPSPLPGPSYIRPSKRRRQLKQQNQNSSHDEMLYDPAMSYDPAMPSGPSNPNEAPQTFQNRQEQVPVGYDGSGVYFAAASTISNDARVSRDRAAERVVTDDGYRREHMPQLALAPEYPSRGSHMGRNIRGDVVSDVMLPYRNSPQATRYSVHPEGDVFHEATSQHHPGRILYDAYGREYFEPPRQIIRQSMAPSPLPGDPDRLFDRPPVPPLARYQGPGALEERGYMFAQAASPYVAPRRILTQPEYVTFENRDVRYREYSTRPLAATRESVPPRPQEQRIYAEGGREYINRASSIHPTEQTRVTSGPGPHDPVANVRPEASGVIYGAERRGPARVFTTYSYGPWGDNQGMMDRPGGVVNMYTDASNEAASSRTAMAQDARYGRGTMQDGFR